MFLKNSTGHFNGAAQARGKEIHGITSSSSSSKLEQVPLASSETMVDLSHLVHEEVPTHEYNWQTFYGNIRVISKISTVIF